MTMCFLHKIEWLIFKLFSDDDYEADNVMNSSETLQLKYDTLLAATNNFSEENKLGQGGFGPVYKVIKTMLQ